MPMQPSPTAETSRLPLPSVRFCMMPTPVYAPSRLDRWWRLRPGRAVARPMSRVLVFGLDGRRLAVLHGPIRGPAGQERERLLGGGAGLGGVGDDAQAGIGRHLERLIGQLEVADHGVVVSLVPGAVQPH